MRTRYDYRNCQSLFGYAFTVHQRSQAVCQLCGCDAGHPLNFDLWRQLTVEHLIGGSQGGYPSQLRAAITRRFPELSYEEREELVQQLDTANTVTACSFCNSTTSRDRQPKDMDQLLTEATGTPNEVVTTVIAKLQQILERKRADVQWKLQSVREAFEQRVAPTLMKGRED
jgi:hypothetical protein